MSAINVLKKLSLAALGATMFVSVITQNAQAAIIGVGAGGQIILAPSDVGDAGVGSDEHMLGFDEMQNVMLPRAVQIDDINANNWIPAGILVDSHMILLNHFDQADTSGLSRIVDWTFDGAIIGVMSDMNGFLERDSNDILGAPGTAYPGSFPARGLEANDLYQIIAPNIIRVDMSISQPGDWIRVVTTPTPEPASIIGLLGLGTLGMTALKRKKTI